MSATQHTSTGHVAAHAEWLDAHFESCRTEYRQALEFVGIQPGWTVLDAGCGSGGFLPRMTDLVGPAGQVVALDLAPENIAHVEQLARTDARMARVQAKVGSLLELPFEDGVFDCIWSANVVQYLTDAEFARSVSECKRVLRPGGILAIKDVDTRHYGLQPTELGLFERVFAARNAVMAQKGVIGGAGGDTLPARLREAGLLQVRGKGWMVENWAPASRATREFVGNVLKLWGNIAPSYDLPPADLAFWKAAEADPSTVIDDPNFCWREFFVVAVGRNPSTFAPA